MNFTRRWLANRPWKARYGVATASVVFVFLGQYLLGSFHLSSVLLCFIPAIIFSSWYGGTRSGLFATALSGLLSFLWWINVANLERVPVVRDFIQVGLFAGLGVYISRLSSRSPSPKLEQSLDPRHWELLHRLGYGIDQYGDDQISHLLTQLFNIKGALDQAAILAITDPDGVIQYVNDRFCQISQFSREELIGKTHRLINSGYHSKAFFQTFWSTIRRGEVWQGEIQNRAKDGSVYWVDTTIVPILDQQGEVQQFLAIRFDITQRKQAELELQCLNDRLENLVEERTARLQQSLGFESTLKRITDKVRDSLDEAQILQAAVGELAEGLGASSCHAALYDLDQGTSTIRYEFNPSIFSTQGQVTAMSDEPEIYQMLLQGEYLQFCNLERHPIRGRVTMLACPMLDAQEVVGNLWLVIDKEYAFREIEIRLVQQVANQCAIALRQARLYENAQAQVKMLEQVNWLKDDFLSTVSHELRTPVSNMKMSIHMLELMFRQNLAEPNSITKASQYLKILKHECEREISLINDLLDLQRLEAGQRSLVMETVQVEPWLTQLLHPFENRIRDRDLLLRLQIPAQELSPLVTDIPALERVLSELINNACKYTPPRGEITISVRAMPGIMQFAVRNSGVEISADELARIFDKFYRIPNSDPWKQGGTGLGLALVQRLVAHLNGTITVESQAQETEFTVEIPNQLVRTSADLGKRPELEVDSW